MTQHRKDTTVKNIQTIIDRIIGSYKVWRVENPNQHKKLVGVVVSLLAITVIAITWTYRIAMWIVLAAAAMGFIALATFGKSEASKKAKDIMSQVKAKAEELQAQAVTAAASRKEVK